MRSRSVAASVAGGGFPLPFLAGEKFSAVFGWWGKLSGMCKRVRFFDALGGKSRDYVRRNNVSKFKHAQFNVCFPFIKVEPKQPLNFEIERTIGPIKMLSTKQKVSNIWAWVGVTKAVFKFPPLTSGNTQTVFPAMPLFEKSLDCTFLVSNTIRRSENTRVIFTEFSRATRKRPQKARTKIEARCQCAWIKRVRFVGTKTIIIPIAYEKKGDWILISSSFFPLMRRREENYAWRIALRKHVRKSASPVGPFPRRLFFIPPCEAQHPLNCVEKKSVELCVQSPN